MCELQELAVRILFFFPRQMLRLRYKTATREENNNLQMKAQKISLIEYQTLEFILFKYCVLMVYFLSIVDIASLL